MKLAWIRRVWKLLDESFWERNKVFGRKGP